MWLHCCIFVTTLNIKEMKTELLRLRIEEELLKKLEELAESNALSVSAQVRMLIKKATDNV